MKTGKKYFLIITAVFLISRLLYYLAEVRFSLYNLYYPGQFLDPLLLRENLAQSLFFLHCQPPLFNLILGIVLKLFPTDPVIGFNLVYLTMGFLLSISLFYLMRRLKVGSGISLILTGVFMISPSCVLFENYLFYTYFVTAFLCFSALFLHRYLTKNRLADAVVFFFLIAGLVLIRNVFHIFWFFFIAGIVFFFQRGERKKIFLAFIGPCLILLFVYGKTFIVFGYPAASTSLGMSLYHVAACFMPEETRREAVRSSDGGISDLSLLSPVPTLKPLRCYPARWKSYEATGIPVLDQTHKSNGKDTNFNHIAYIAIGKQYTGDALKLILRYPGYYFHSILFAIESYFRPASDYFCDFEDGRMPLPRISRIYNLAISGRFICPVKPVSRVDSPVKYYASRLSIFFLIGIPLLIIFGLSVTWKSLRRKVPDRPYALTMLFIMINIITVTLVANLLSMGENMRHRFVLEPYFLVLLGLFLRSIKRRLGLSRKGRVKKIRSE